MKKLVIILAISIILFAALKHQTGQPATVAVGVSQNTATVQPKELPETHTDQVERATEIACEPVPTETKKGEPAVQEKPTSESTTATDEPKVAESEETVKCVDQGDQSLSEYKSQPSRQPNPFENAKLVEIADHPVEDLIGKGEERPGEGKHF